MPIQIVPLEIEHLPAIARFSQRVWNRPDHASYFRWRYLEAPSQTTLMALSGDDCLAVLSVFTRPYRVAAGQVLCSETADWHCLPELRGSGIGIRLMRRVVEMGRPILAVDGSEDTRSLLPRLGWREVGRATRFVRPLKVESLAQALRGRLRRRRHGERRSPLGRLGRLREWFLGGLFRPRSPRPPAGGVAVQATRLDADLLTIYDGRPECATVPLPVPAQIEWLVQGVAPERHFICLHFRIDGALKGWGLLRMDGLGEVAEATLLELFTPEPALYPWMVAEAVACAAGLAAQQISALASCPALASVLRKSRFWAREETPIHCFGATGDFPLQPLHLGSNIGDAALMPYPTPWWSSLPGVRP